MPETHSQRDLTATLALAESPALAFVKDQPLMVYRLTAESAGDVPEAITSRIGEVDRTSYGGEHDDSIEAFLATRVGGAVVLQVDGDDPDFYPIARDVLERDYELLDVAAVEARNPRLVERLRRIEGIDRLLGADDKVVGALKTVPVRMRRTSELGHPVDSELTIEAPWGGTQTKPPGQDAFLVLGGEGVYMVNAGADGLPIGYRRSMR